MSGNGRIIDTNNKIKFVLLNTIFEELFFPNTGKWRTSRSSCSSSMSFEYRRVKFTLNIASATPPGDDTMK